MRSDSTATPDIADLLPEDAASLQELANLVAKKARAAARKERQKDLEQEVHTYFRDQGMFQGMFGAADWYTNFDWRDTSGTTMPGYLGGFPHKPQALVELREKLEDEEFHTVFFETLKKERGLVNFYVANDCVFFKGSPPMAHLKPYHEVLTHILEGLRNNKEK